MIHMRKLSNIGRRCSNLHANSISSFALLRPSLTPPSQGNNKYQLVSRKRISTDTIVADALVSDAVAPQLGWSLSHIAMYTVDQIHLLAHVPYWEAIVIATLCIRVAILPIALQTVRNSARMAALRPDMQKLQDAMAKDPHIDDPRVKTRYMEEMKALFVHHKVNPLRAFAMPFIQLPLFISFFFGLQGMGTYFPDYASGGDFWFPNLALADPLLILPITNALSFLLMLEMGADGIQTSQQATFKWVMRAFAVAIVPLTYHMPVGLFVYWNTNNVFSIFQTLALKSNYLKTRLDIPDMPKSEEAPVFKMRNPFAASSTSPFSPRAPLTGSRSNNLSEGAQEVEIIDPSIPPPPPSSVNRGASSALGAPPVTFAMPPRKKKTTSST